MMTKEKKEKRKRKDSRAHGAVTSIGGSPGRARAVRILRGVYVPSYCNASSTRMGAGASVEGSAEEEAQRRNTIPMVRGKGGNVNPLDSLAPFSLQRSVNVEIKLRKGTFAAALFCCVRTSLRAASTGPPRRSANSCVDPRRATRGGCRAAARRRSRAVLIAAPPCKRAGSPDTAPTFHPSPVAPQTSSRRTPARSRRSTR